MQQGQEVLGGVVKEVDKFAGTIADKFRPELISPVVNEKPKLVKKLPSGLKISLSTPISTASAQLKKQEQIKLQEKKVTTSKKVTLPDGRVVGGETLSQGKAPSVWDNVVEFFGNITGNSAKDQQARAMNAKAVQDVSGEKLYQQRIKQIANEGKVPVKAVDQSIQQQAKMQGKSKYDLVGLSLTDLSQQGGNPFKNSTMENTLKELGVGNIPTNKEFTDIVMTAALGFGLASATVATLKAVGIFSAVNEVKSGLINALKGDGFKVGAGQTLSDLTESSTPMPVKTALDFIDFLGTSAVVGGVFKFSPKFGEKLTKDVITKYNVPQTLHFSPKQVESVIKGTEIGKMKDDMAKLGLSSSEWRTAAKKGIEVTLPTEKVITIVDKPYWSKLKGLIGMEEAAPVTTVIKDGKKINNIAGYLPSGEYTPQEAIGRIYNSPLAKTVEGKEILKASIQAQEQGRNIIVESPELTVKVVTKETLAKENAQKLVRISPDGNYKSALEQQSTEALHSDPIKFRDEYIEKNGNIVNPDLARKLSEEYTGINSNELNNFGSGVKNIVLEHLLDTGKQRTDSNKTVYWTGGGPGSGKSTTLNALDSADKKQYIAIIDTTLAPKSSVKDISRILNKGYKVEIDYTLADPFESWKRVVARTLDDKSPDYNRIVSEEYFIEAHKNARDNAVEAYDKFHTNPAFDIAFYKNLGRPEDYKEITVDFVKAFEYNSDKLRNQIHEYTDKLKTEGKITEEVYNGFTEDRPKKEAYSGVQKSDKPVKSEKSVLTSEEQESVNIVSEMLYSGELQAATEFYNSISTELPNIPPLEEIKTQVEQQQQEILDDLQVELAEMKKGDRAADPDDPTNQLLEVADKLALHFKKRGAIWKITGKERKYTIDTGGKEISTIVGGDTVAALDKLIYNTDIDGLKKNLRILHVKFDKVFTELYNKDIHGGDYEEFKQQFAKQFESRAGDTSRSRKSVQDSSGQSKSQKTGNSDKVTQTSGSTGGEALGNFENQNPQTKVTNFKIATETKKLIRKYADRIGEGHLNKGNLGQFHHESQNILTEGINNFSVNVHEITHAIDFKRKISKEFYKESGTNDKGMPIYESETASLRKELTDLYTKYYPTGRTTHAVKKKMVEGYATFIQKYIEMPKTITAEFPNLYRDIISKDGKYYDPIVNAFIKDAQQVVSNYQGLDDLDKVGARIANEVMKTDKSFLNFFEKARTILEDEIYPIEKVGKIAGTEWSNDDPSLWVRQYSRGGGVYANNILHAKKGYWSLNEEGEFVKLHKFNWKTLIDDLSKTKSVDAFGNYLVARDQTFQWKELDKLQKEYEDKREVLDLAEKFDIKLSEIKNSELIAEELGIEVKELNSIIDEALSAKKAYEDQEKYLNNNGFLRDEVEQAYLGNKERFAKEAATYDTLVREDLNLLHNELVGMVDNEKYSKLTSKEGYASMKRQFFDDIVGDAKEIYQGPGGKLAPKISSLKHRTGGQQAIINPVLNGIANHIEIMKKSMKMVIYNKMAKIAQKGTAPELFQVLQLRSFADDRGVVTFPQEKDENIIMARIDYKRTPVLVDKIIKSTLDDVLTHQSMNLFEHMMTLAGRTFTIGTTGAYAPFSLVNYPADQWGALANTRNSYKPVIDQIKLLGKAITGLDKTTAKYWNEWAVMGGDRMSLFQSQLQSTDQAVKYITGEKNGIEKVIGLLNKGVDIASIPSKYSETASRFSEYMRARQNGKPQVVALEEAGRVTTPFHHIGNWKFGDKATMKFMIRAIPFGNATLQVLAQTIRTAETPKGRKRLYFVLAAAFAAYLSSMAMVSQYGTDDQKEQYKDLRPNDLAAFLHYPSLSGEGLSRVRISQNYSTMGTIASMIMSQNLFGVKYTAEDYKAALTEWVPKQANILSPVEMFFSWFNPIVKVPIEVFANFKDYPKISPIEGQSMQNLEPKDRYNESTSALAKQIGQTFNISPLKTDYLIQGLFGRATGFITGKPGVYNPTSQVSRDYLLTTGRRVETFYEKQEKYDQQYASLRAKWKEAPTVPEEVIKEAVLLKQKRDAYDYVAQLLKYYREIPKENKEALKKARTQILPYFDKLP